jgi:methyltransferase (TIGR00027 family)
MNPVAITALLVAAMRAEESKRTDKLFDDPFAHALAGDAGYAALRRHREAGGLSAPIIEVRTRWFDEALIGATTAGIRQVAILAAGMDARAYRLAWPAGTRVFELDQPDVLAYKGEVLGVHEPRSRRVALGATLAADWASVLRDSDFDPALPTVWLVEGLTQYLEEASVEALFRGIDSLSAARSMLLYDIVGRLLLESPVLGPARRMMAELGAPWIYGTDDPAGLIAPLGWDVTLSDPGEVGTRWGRWPFPVPPLSVPGIPRGYLVEASKR